MIIKIFVYLVFFLLLEIFLIFNVKRLIGCLMIFFVYFFKNVCVGMLYYKDVLFDILGRWGCMIKNCILIV